MMNINKLTKFAVASLAAMVLMSGCSNNKKHEAANLLEEIKASGKLIVATSPDYPPFEFEDLTKKGQDAYVGSDMTMARYIADKLGVQLQVDAIAFEAVVTNVNEGKAHLAISGLNVDADRLAIADASNVYYSGESQCIVANDELISSINGLDSLKSKTIAAQNGSIQLSLANEQLTDSKIELITTLNDGIMMLKSGKVDGVLMDSSTASQFVKNYPELKMAELPLEYDSEGFSIFMKKGEKELLDEINKIVAEIESENLYPSWLAEAQDLSAKLGLN